MNTYWGLDYAYHFSPVNAAQRAGDSVRRILRDPKTVTFIRNGETLDPQTVRIEKSSGGESANELGEIVVQPIIVFGAKDHPFFPDIDMQTGDRFFYENMMYEIKTVMEFPGELQGYGERVGG